MYGEEFNLITLMYFGIWLAIRIQKRIFENFESIII